MEGRDGGVGTPLGGRLGGTARAEPTRQQPTTAISPRRTAPQTFFNSLGPFWPTPTTTRRDLQIEATSLYNRLERRREALAGGEPLSDDEREDHARARARTPILAELHDAIDRAVLAAYGWADLAPALAGRPGGTVPSAAKGAAQEAAEDEMLSRLIALNRERAGEEARGHVRWLRPDYQAARLGHRVSEPAEQAAMDVAVIALPEALPWPAEPRAQFGAVRAFLDAAPEPLPPEAVARSFRGRLSPQRRARVEELLAIMTDLGIARIGKRDGATLF